MSGWGNPRPSGRGGSQALSASIEQVSVARDSDCPVCGDAPTMTELQDYVTFCAGGLLDGTVTRAQLIDLLQARERGGAQFSLIDIREEYELIHGSIPGAINLPRSTFDPTDLVGEVVLYCQAGVRTQHLLRELNAQGFSGIKHYAGGYIDWVSGRSNRN